MPLKISFHAGLCCGVKHISGFVFPPDFPLGDEGTKEAPSYPTWDKSAPDLNGDDFNSALDPYYGPLPAETMEERFKRLVNFIRYDWREDASGCIEVILDRSQREEGWPEVLAEEGSEHIRHFLNGNSGEMLAIYHLYYGQE